MGDCVLIEVMLVEKGAANEGVLVGRCALHARQTESARLQVLVNGARSSECTNCNYDLVYTPLPSDRGLCMCVAIMAVRTAAQASATATAAQQKGAVAA